MLSDGKFKLLMISYLVCNMFDQAKSGEGRSLSAKYCKFFALVMNS